MGVLAYNLSGIHFFLRENKELTSVLQLVDGISESGTRLHGDDRTIGTALDFTLVRLVFSKAVRHDGLACGSCQYIGTQTDDTA